MLVIRLDDIVVGVIVSLISSALIGIWAFRGKIWLGLVSLYLSTREAITVLITLCIEIVQNLAQLTNDIRGVEFSAGVKFQVSVSPRISEGGRVGMTTAPAAPTVWISGDEVLNTFSATHNELVAECRKRYPDFKQNFRFYKLLESVKKDPNCAHERRLNPNNSKSLIQMFYNLDESLAKLDDEYTKLR